MDVQVPGPGLLLQGDQNLLGLSGMGERGAEVGVGIEQDPLLLHLGGHVLDLVGGPGGDAWNVGLVRLFGADEAYEDILEAAPKLLIRHLFGELRLLQGRVLHSVGVDEEDTHLAARRFEGVLNSLGRASKGYTPSPAWMPHDHED